MEKVFLKISQNSEEITSVGVSFLTVFKKETPTQVLFCEVYVIFKNTEDLQTTAFGSISTAKWLGPKENIMSSMKLHDFWVRGDDRYRKMNNF